jgi:hypothetical protein
VPAETGSPRPQLEALEDLREFILERWQADGASPEQYPWIWEGARWQELAFCLIARLGAPDLDADAARSAAEMLSRLGLLRIEALAALAAEGGEADRSHPDAAFMVQLLERVGAAPERAQAIVTTLAQAGWGLEEHHGGKVQRYLRRYGEAILRELGETFSFSRMSDEDVRYAFTHWLQNVLNMPLPMSDPNVRRLCQERGITVEALVEVADGLDLNLALLDDILAGAPPEYSDAGDQRSVGPQQHKREHRG